MGKLSQKLKNFFYGPKFIALIGFLILVLIFTPLFKNINKRYLVNKEINELEQEIKEMEFQNKEFKNFISYIESDQFLEEQARLKFGLKKPGEEVAVILDDFSEADQENAIGGEKERRSNFQKWVKYFFN